MTDTTTTVPDGTVATTGTATAPPAGPDGLIDHLPQSAPPLARPTHAGPLATAQAQLARAIEHLGYDSGMHAMLATPRREINVAIPLRRDDGSTVLFQGFRVQHN